MDEIQWDTVEYFVKTMLHAGVEVPSIIRISRKMAFLFGVRTEIEAELAVREYIYRLKDLKQR